MEWEPFTYTEDFSVGDRFSHTSWGDPSNPNSIVTQVTHIEPNGQFYWLIIQPNRKLNRPYLVGTRGSLNSPGWSIKKAFKTFQYDPSQAGDTDDDI